jgi:hypothetical protein
VQWYSGFQAMKSMLDSAMSLKIKTGGALRLAQVILLVSVILLIFPMKLLMSNGLTEPKSTIKFFLGLF